MSREFTPETERQRLQFLVRKTFLLISFLPSHLAAPPQSPRAPCRGCPLCGVRGPAAGTHPSWPGGAARELPPLAVPWLPGSWLAAGPGMPGSWHRVGRSAWSWFSPSRPALTLGPQSVPSPWWHHVLPACHTRLLCVPACRGAWVRALHLWCPLVCLGGPQRCAQSYFRAWMPAGGQLKCASGFLAFFLKAPSPACPGQTFLCRTMRLFKVIKTSLMAARRRRRFC